MDTVFLFVCFLNHLQPPLGIFFAPKGEKFQQDPSKMVLKCAPKTGIGEFQPSFPGLEQGLSEAAGAGLLGRFRVDFRENSSSREGTSTGKSSQGMGRALGPLEPKEFLGNAVGYLGFLCPVQGWGIPVWDFPGFQGRVRDPRPRGPSRPCPTINSFPSSPAG